MNLVKGSNTLRKNQSITFRDTSRRPKIITQMKELEDRRIDHKALPIRKVCMARSDILKVWSIIRNGIDRYKVSEYRDLRSMGNLDACVWIDGLPIEIGRTRD